MKPLIIIPARGGSKGLPSKNIKKLKGKPLIQYTISAAQEVFSNDQILVSTDSEEIKKISEEMGIKVPFLRPPSLASDYAGMFEVLVHAYNEYLKNGYEANLIVLLQPTSPLRNGNHIKEALESYRDEIDMVMSVSQSKANPYFSLFEEEHSFLKKSKNEFFKRRQDCPKVWQANGAIYIINSKSLLSSQNLNFDKIVKFEMTEEESVDIDNQLDWDICELLIDKNCKIL